MSEAMTTVVHDLCTELDQARTVPAEVRDAYKRLTERCAWWAAS